MQSSDFILIEERSPHPLPPSPCPDMAAEILMCLAARGPQPGNIGGIAGCISHKSNDFAFGIGCHPSSFHDFIWFIGLATRSNGTSVFVPAVIRNASSQLFDNGVTAFSVAGIGRQSSAASDDETVGVRPYIRAAGWGN